MIDLLFAGVIIGFAIYGLIKFVDAAVDNFRYWR